jgi:ATP-dependent Clp protease ATP-binding subunit ClpB
VLFDEIEKAHPDVFNVLLQVLEDGRLTDGQGRTVDFKNTVIIMTSNLGGQAIIELGAKNSEHAKERVMDALRQTFRPEFLNRVDEIIVFETLGRQHLARIIDLQLDKLAERLTQRHISVEFTDAARQLLIDEGYDPQYGARPLKRTIQRRVLDPLAMQVLAGEFHEGDHIVVDRDGGSLSFTAAPSPALEGALAGRP